MYWDGNNWQRERVAQVRCHSCYWVRETLKYGKPEINEKNQEHAIWNKSNLKQESSNIPHHSPRAKTIISGIKKHYFSIQKYPMISVHFLQNHHYNHHKLSLCHCHLNLSSHIPPNVIVMSVARYQISSPTTQPVACIICILKFSLFFDQWKSFGKNACLIEERQHSGKKLPQHSQHASKQL